MQTKKAKRKPPAKTKKDKKGSVSLGSSGPAEKIRMAPMPNAGKVITDFEKTLEAAIGEEPQPQHGGARPGAGRKAKPMPAEIDRIQPAEIGAAVVQFLKIPFDLWAAKSKIPELALTEDEAQTAARPTMILLDHYSPNLGEIAIAWASLAVVAAAIMRPRIILLRKFPKRGQVVKAGGADTEAATAPPMPKTKTGFPNDSEIKPAKL
jgi:hypothetical protein